MEEAIFSFNAQPIIRYNEREMWANDTKLLVIGENKQLLRLYPIEDVTDEVIEFELS